MQHPFLRFLTSLKLTIYLLLFIAAASGIATFIESRHGALGAQALVYNTRWFEAALALLGLNLFLLLIKRLPYHRRQTGFVIVHVAIIVILCGAAITRFFGYEGIMPIREGESTNFIYSDRDHVQLSVAGHDASFAVRLFRPGPQRISRKVNVGGQTYRLSVREYWPHWAETYVPAEGGTPAVKLAIVTSSGMESRFLLSGDTDHIGASSLTYLASALPEKISTAPRGELLVRLEGTTHRLPVPAEPPVQLQAGGFTFTITEFQPDFKVGQKSDPDQPLSNPMIRVAITSPTGQEGERLLFAFHPDFDMSHSKQEDEFQILHLVYNFEQGVTFTTGGKTGLLGRAGMQLSEMDMTTAEVAREIPAGEIFEVNELILYQDSTGGLSFVVQEILPSVILQPSPSDDPSMPAAVRITIQDQDGATAEAVVLRGSPAGQTVTIGGRQATLRLGPVKITVPYRLQLDDFVLLTYPGSENPASYESHVRLYDPEQGIEGRPARIYMNHPLTHRGYKHFQSSYDQDRLGTVLSVNHDPGRWPTYLGYTLIALGFILILAKDLIWPLPTRSDGSQL